MAKELFAMVPGYGDRYLVSNHGKVISLNIGSEMAQYVQKNGYAAVKLRSHNTKKTFLVHRLVASAFVPNPDNLPEVNHIDGNKLNNSFNNLEWVTHSQNMKHAVEAGLYDPVGSGHMRRMAERASEVRRAKALAGVVGDE